MQWEADREQTLGRVSEDGDGLVVGVGTGERGLDETLFGGLSQEGIVKFHRFLRLRF